ncbi:MAG: excinuclease subunit, partial [Kribbellaceae bacterium]|nr:excinuclease subunit [Kribbellaceae bacterium]
GQPAPTLSGGEAQRVKLASELQKRSTGRTVYVLDEPTTGLHFEDIRKLLGVLGSLVDKGNSVLVIVHNLDVIKTADWIVDLGPDGGRRGGTLVAEGTPEEVAANPASYTGEFLAEILHGRAAKPSARKQAAAAKTAPKAAAGSKVNGAKATTKTAAKKTAAKKVAVKKAPAKKVAAKRAVK